jgi:hypothetical protein
MEEHHSHFRMYEIIPELVPGAQPKHSNLSEWIYQAWIFLTHSLTKSHEPCIWQTRDRDGEIWWNAHDPMSGRSLVCTTEEEVQIWLEQLPYA